MALWVEEGGGAPDGDDSLAVERAALTTVATLLGDNLAAARCASMLVVIDAREHPAVGKHICEANRALVSQVNHPC